MAVFPTQDAHARRHGAWEERKAVTDKACLPNGCVCTFFPWEDTPIMGVGGGGHLDFSFSSSSFERASGDRELFQRSDCELG